jgi:hypothetical protein
MSAGGRYDAGHSLDALGEALDHLVERPARRRRECRVFIAPRRAPGLARAMPHDAAGRRQAMKKLMTGATVVGLVLAFVSIAAAQHAGWGRMGMGAGPMMGAAGPGWAGGGASFCPMASSWGAGATNEPAAAVTEDKAKEIATEYVAKYMKGYTIERVLPFTGRFRTAYQVELKGPKGETRLLHVNPWGAVRPFGGPLAEND